MAREKTEAELRGERELAEQKAADEAAAALASGETVNVPLATIKAMQEQMAKFESDLEVERGARAALEIMVGDSKEIDTTGDKKLREKNNYEPKFHTVRLRKFPIAGDYDKQGYVIGWTNRGAYQQVDRTGISPQNVDYIEIFFLGQERDKGGKLQAEKVKLLDLLNAPQVVCKIIDTKKEVKKVPTDEEIDVRVFDPTHGLMETGGLIDGYSAFTEITYKIQVPGLDEPIEVDGMYLN